MLIGSTGEIFLKGKNKNFFIKRLLKNVRCALRTENVEFVHNKILCDDAQDWQDIRFVFGITSYALTKKASFSELGDVALSMIDHEKTFRVTTARRVKAYKTSQEIDKEVGAFICAQKQDMKVQLKKPEAEICIDVFKDCAYVYKKKDAGLGGLPVGVSGEVYVEVRDVKKATVAGFLMMKRGCVLVTSQELPDLQKFMHGFKILAREKLPRDILVNDATFEETISGMQSKQTIFTPLIGLSEKEIEALYQQIVQL